MEISSKRQRSQDKNRDNTKKTKIVHRPTIAQIAATASKHQLKNAPPQKELTRAEIEKLKEEARRQRKEEKAAQTRFVDQDIQELVDEMNERGIDKEAPSTRDLLYNDAVSDFDKVSDEYQKKEILGKMRLFAFYVNLYSTVVEGKEICPMFFDKSGNVAVKETKFHL